MSSNNPYAVNGSTSPSRNPYGGTTSYGSSNRYADPYISQNHDSNTSLNSFAARDSRRRRDDAPRNPYEQRSPSRNSPAPSSNPYAQAEPSLDDSQTSLGQPDQPARGGYGGLGGFTQEYERRQTPPTRSGPTSRERERQRNREGMISGGRSGEPRIFPDDRELAPAPLRTTPQASISASNINLQSTSNGTYGRNHQTSPRRSGKSMDEILRHIQNHWRIMEGDECVPVKVALQLADPSSLGLGDREADFADTHIDLQRCLKSVVNEHYADFNSAVGTYHKIQSSIKESQGRVKYLKNGLMGVKGGMLTTRPELRNLAEQSGELDNLLVVLNSMESLREMPSRLEEKINEKRWLGAVEVLGEALRGCRKSEFDSIGAMSDLRSYFSNQESSLVDMLIEELHDHLYLKSPYCADRWKGRKLNSASEQPATQNLGGNVWERPVYQFLNALDSNKAMTDDASKNPESDTFYYIQMIMEALNKLGYLEETVGRIEQRMPIELYKVVDRTNSEIDGKYPSHLRVQTDQNKAKLNILANENRSQILSDFLWTLYAKFEAIAEGHRVLHEVVYGIVERENTPNPDSFIAGFKELWKLYQMEMRSLLHDYLATDSEVSASGNKTTTTATDLFARHTRDKNKRMFKLGEVDEKSSDIKAEKDELEEILKTSVPGLVTKSKSQGGLSGSSERGHQDGTAAGHKLLIEPSVFNMTVLLPPSLAFLQNLRDIVPQTSKIPMSTLTSFLDDFLINVFHSQLEEAVTELCAQSMMDMEAFMEDPQWSKHSPHPIFKGTLTFMTLIRAFASMLSSIPQDQLFTQLIITQLLRYYDKCYGFYKSIVSRVASAGPNSNATVQTMKAAAAFADNGDVRDTALQLWLLDLSDRVSRNELIGKEVTQLLTAIKATPIQAYDIISDPKSVHQLSLIYNSMQWLSSSVFQLRHVETVSSSGQSHSRNTSLTGTQNPRRWTLVNKIKTTNPKSVLDAQPAYLPLNSETVIAFDETMASFRGLAQKALLTLHIDIRCGLVHQLGRTLRPPENLNGAATSPTPHEPTETNQPALSSGMYPFVLPSPPTSASPRILELNNDLISFDANVSAYLGIREHNFILAGLGRLVDRYLVVGADYIQVMNKEGAERMRVDGMVVQQVLRGLGVGSKATMESHLTQNNMLNTEGHGLGIGSLTKTIDPNNNDNDALLTSSSQYYELFLRGPDAIMEYVRDMKAAKPPQDVGYTYDELRTLLELCFSASVRGEDREDAMKARKKMGDLLLQLGELMWDS